MSEFRRRGIVLLCGSILTAVGGCSGGGTAPADSRTAGQYFSEQQARTVTPNGRIMSGSVAEADGQIEYTTEDGKRWRVSYSKRAEGTYEYGTPNEVR
jgi:hypothetical protein